VVPKGATGFFMGFSGMVYTHRAISEVPDEMDG